MTPFDRLEAVAAPLPLANIDTDKILAARFMKTIGRKGLGRGLFATLRENPDFVLNRAPWDHAAILVTLDNFGCGSSREHAPWALLDFGLRCIIAPSFADIFYSNCFKNGMLPISVPRGVVNDLVTLADNPDTARMVIDLHAQTIIAADGRQFGFDIDPRRKRDLLAGTDDIAHSLELAPEIAAFEAARRERQPWLTDIDPVALEATSTDLMNRKAET